MENSYKISSETFKSILGGDEIILRRIPEGDFTNSNECIAIVAEDNMSNETFKSITGGDEIIIRRLP